MHGVGGCLLLVMAIAIAEQSTRRRSGLVGLDAGILRRLLTFLCGPRQQGREGEGRGVHGPACLSWLAVCGDGCVSWSDGSINEAARNATAATDTRQSASEANDRKRQDNTFHA